MREIIRHLIDGDMSWFDRDDVHIKVGDKDGYWIMNYGIEKATEWNHLVRGMVVKKPPTGWSGDELDLIKSFPFTRFFNKHESPAADVDFENAEMIEKLDGTMVGIFFPSGEPGSPQWHTRRMMSTQPEDMSHNMSGFHGGSYNLMNLIGTFVKKIPFTKEDVNRTYILEFIHKATFVVTKYRDDQEGLYLLGGRDLETHEELDEAELDRVAKRLNLFRPRRWDSISDHDEILKMMKEIEKTTPNFEGFVFRDKESGKRVKVKDPDYVNIHHMINDLSFKNLIGKVLEGEADEIVSYFPSSKSRVELIQNKYKAYLDHVVNSILKWQSEGLRGGELAVALMGKKPKRWEKGDAIMGKEKDKWLMSQVFRFIDVEDESEIRSKVDSNLRHMALGHNKSPKKLIELIGLDDE